MKTNYVLDVLESQYREFDNHKTTGTAKIIGEANDETIPYVKFEVRGYSNGVKYTSACIKDKDLERFAVNILKALKSRHLAK